MSTSSPSKPDPRETLPDDWGRPGRKPKVGDFARPMAGEYADRVGYVCKQGNGRVTIRLWDEGNVTHRSYTDDLVRVRWLAEEIELR